MNLHRMRARDYIEHMRDSALRIQEYVVGKSEIEFLSNGLLQDGVIRQLEIIGEASRQLRCTSGRIAEIPLHPLPYDVCHEKSTHSRVP